VAEFTVPLAELNRDRWPSSPKPADPYGLHVNCVRAGTYEVLIFIISVTSTK